MSPKWYTVSQVAALLGYGLSKTKALVANGKIQSIKDGGSRRVMPEWVDDYIQRVTGTA
ncbi:excisionase family DNA-binding protein [Actinosynnema pretiosum]|uniref:excisionase family DNA-binding protein n=1 Tax=Actinosynnema pretiosum TaxID=42197 RepID=UPI001C42E64D|nr:excisionase family DNA-binding protein [Actinosynnema pretiosum]